MNQPEKITTQLFLAVAVDGSEVAPHRVGRKPRHDETVLSEDVRKEIKLLDRYRSLFHGPRFRSLQLRIGNLIHSRRYPGSRTGCKIAKAKWLKANKPRRKTIAMLSYYRTRPALQNATLPLSTVAFKCRRHRRNNIQFSIACRLRAVMGRALRRQFTRKSARTFDLIGCTPTELKAHIESLFVCGMSWANRHLWHVDHKRPLASFDLRDPDQQREAFHYTNLQPLWSEENRRKGARVV